MKSDILHAICRVIDTVLLCPSLRTRSQEFSVINPSVLLLDIHHAVVQYLISSLMSGFMSLKIKLTLTENV